jgi:hypothetical protein
VDDIGTVTTDGALSLTVDGKSVAADAAEIAELRNVIQRELA